MTDDQAFFIRDPFKMDPQSVGQAVLMTVLEVLDHAIRVAFVTEGSASPAL